MNCPHGVRVDHGPPCGACVRGEPATSRRLGRTFTMRLSDDEAVMLERQSRALGLNASSYLRMLVKLRHDELARMGKLHPRKAAR
jgi:hypothetical protein